MKRTALYPVYDKYKAKIGMSGVWEVPLEFTGVKEEHLAARNNVGLFDLSTMGEIDIKGPDALKALQYLFVNDLSNITEGQVIYSSMCNDNGGIVDDATVYCFSKDHYWIVTSTANAEKSVNWVIEKSKDNKVYVTDVGAGIALLSLQGPNSDVVLKNIVKADISELKYFRFKLIDSIDGIPIMVSRTGFTGEKGYEIYVQSIYACHLWDQIMEKGKEVDIVACGLYSIVSLRLEKAYVLYNRDIDETISPAEVGLGWTVKPLTHDFIGKQILEKQLRNGVSRKLVGFEIEGDSIPKTGDTILYQGKKVGNVTSAGIGYSLGKNIALGFVPESLASPGTGFEIDNGESRCKVLLVQTPFYDPKGERPHA